MISQWSIIIQKSLITGELVNCVAQMSTNSYFSLPLLPVFAALFALDNDSRKVKVNVLWPKV